MGRSNTALMKKQFRLDIRVDRQSQVQRRMEVVAERPHIVDETGTIRAPISREPPIDRPAQDFEAEPPSQVLEADLLAR